LPLTVVQGDQSAALFAFGEPRADTLYLNLGTGAFLQRPVDGALSDPAPLLASVVFADERAARSVLEGTVNGAASAIEELAAELGVDDPIAALPRWLDEVRDPPLFVNGVSGVGSPFWIPNLASRFVGDRAGNGEEATAARMVAVVESIAFLVRANLDAFEHRLARARRIVATGGLSRLDRLCTRIASLADTRIERPPALEATAIGLARLVAADTADTAERGEPGDEIEPRPDPALARRYASWLDEMSRASAPP
jgi:glycerol kinase